MKTLLRLSMIVMICTAVAAAQEPSSVRSVSPRVISSLLEGLSSDNAGVQRSCALMLGQMRFSRSRIALMKVLRNGKDEQSRCAAAWALCRIGDPSGLMVVRTMAEKGDSALLRASCAWYYRQAAQEQALRKG